jgi:hypothetical protein
MSLANNATKALLAVAVTALSGEAAFGQPASDPTSVSAVCRDRSGYWCDNWRGWHFYEDPAPEPPPPKDKPAAPRPPLDAPADGLIAGTGRIAGRPVMITASDYTALGGSVQCGLGKAHGTCGDSESPGIQGGEGKGESSALGTDQPFGPDLDIIEVHACRAGRVRAHLALGLCRGDSLRIARHEEATDPSCAIVGRAHHDAVEIGHAAMGDPGLAAVDDVALAPLVRSSGECGRVTAGMRLGETVGAQSLPREHPGQPGSLLVVGTRGRHGETGERVDAHADAHGQPVSRDLLEHLEVYLVRLAASPELLGVWEGEQTRLAEGAQLLAWES